MAGPYDWLHTLPHATKANPTFFFLLIGFNTRRNITNFLFKTILKEVRIRFFWIFICFSLTWFTCYWFSEDLFFLSAKPFLILSYSGFICTQLTEALSTYVTISLISCFYFLFPFLSYQIWCFLIPSCYEEQRKKYNKFFYLSGFCFFLFFFVTFVEVVPNVWHFLYELNKTSTNLLIIKLQSTMQTTPNLSKDTSTHPTPPTKTPSYMPSTLSNTNFDMTSKSHNMECVRQCQETTTRCTRCKIHATYVGNTSNSTVEKTRQYKTIFGFNRGGGQGKYLQSFYMIS